MTKKLERPSLSNVLQRCKPFFVYAAIFSFIEKLLTMGGAIYMMSVFDRVIPSRSNETLFFLTLIFIYIEIIEVVVGVFRSRIFNRLGDVIFLKLREPILKVTLRYQLQTPSSYSSAFDDLETVKNFLGGQGLRAAFELPWIPIFLLVLWVFHPFLALLAIVGSALLFFLAYLEDVVTKKVSVLAGIKQRQAKVYIENAKRASELVQALGMRESVSKRWIRMNDEYIHHSLDARNKIGRIVAMSKFISGIKRTLSIGIAAYLVLNVEGVSSGVLLASTIIMGKTMGPIMTVLSSWRSYLGFKESLQNLEELFSEENWPEEGFVPPPPKGHVTVSNLLYFIDRKHFILNGINFEVQEGEALGVIGTSASGKTTLARLLVGVLEPSDGAVRLDSSDIYQWSINGLGEWIGYVPQEQQLFEGSVADNIARMGDAYARAEEVVSAAQLAGVHEMILKLPNGYDTDVGVNGKKLSGGQRQMISLARALFGSPKLIVMDEPNNSLDGQSEGLLLDLINRLKEKKITQIIISHKPSILQDVDKMLVLGQSKQLMFGTKSEVLTWLKVGKKTKVKPLKTPPKIQQNID